MTALGNVIALIGQLDDEQVDVPVRGVGAPHRQFCELPPVCVAASSLGEVMAFIRGITGAAELDTDEGQAGGETAANRVAEIVSRTRGVTYARARATAEMRI